MNQSQTIRVSTLKEGTNPLQLELPPEALDIRSYPGCEMALLSRVTADLNLLKSRDEVFVTGKVRFRAALSCADCGVEFERDFLEPLTMQFDRALPIKADAKIHELSDNELERTAYEGDEIDLLPAVRDTVLLAIPIAPLCTPECKGVCPECGANLNIEECQCCVAAGCKSMAC